MPRALALDYGTVRLGVAVSDPLGAFAQPLPYLPATPPKAALEKLQGLCQEYDIDRIVLGLPKNMDGSEGESAQAARQLGAAVERATGLAVVFIDERLTTAAAERVLLEADLSRRKRREKVDGVAAAMILQTYLDMPLPPSPSP